MNGKLKTLAALAVAELIAQNKKVSFAESCTGGIVAAAICSVSGASSVFEGSAVSYSDRIKNELLGVPKKILLEKSAVSSECALAMAEGAAELYGADIALSVTGYAGPTGDSVGLVYIALCDGEKSAVHEMNFSGDRDEIRVSAAEAVLSLLVGHLCSGQ